MSDKKNKKKKVVYYDDGRTIADMSGLYGKPAGDETDKKSDNSNDSRKYSTGTSYKPRGNSLKDQAATYWNTVKTLFLPMLATLGIISAAFLVLWILLEIASLAY